MPRGVPKNGKRKTKPKADKEKEDFSLSPVEKEEAGKELEQMFNICGEHGHMPSDTIFKLVRWLQADG